MADSEDIAAQTRHRLKGDKEPEEHTLPEGVLDPELLDEFEEQLFDLMRHAGSDEVLNARNLLRAAKVVCPEFSLPAVLSEEGEIPIESYAILVLSLNNQVLIPNNRVIYANICRGEIEFCVGTIHPESAHSKEYLGGTSIDSYHANLSYSDEHVFGFSVGNKIFIDPKRLGAAGLEMFEFVQGDYSKSPEDFRERVKPILDELQVLFFELHISPEQYADLFMLQFERSRLEQAARDTVFTSLMNGEHFEYQDGGLKKAGAIFRPTSTLAGFLNEPTLNWEIKAERALAINHYAAFLGALKSMIEEHEIAGEHRLGLATLLDAICFALPVGLTFERMPNRKPSLQEQSILWFIEDLSDFDVNSPKRFLEFVTKRSEDGRQLEPLKLIDTIYNRHFWSESERRKLLPLAL